MSRKMLCCGILKQEMEHLMQGREVEMSFIDAALHVDFDKLASLLTGALDELDEKGIVMVIGDQCHPDMEKMANERSGILLKGKNCIELLLGDRMAQLDAEARTFYLTGGWLENWRGIFIEGLKWDEVDARQNFGYYDRVLLLDTGLVPIDEEKILEFYDYTQVPIEIMPIDLDNLRALLEQALEQSPDR